MKFFGPEGSDYYPELNGILLADRIIFRCFDTQVLHATEKQKVAGFGHRERMVAEMASCGASCHMEDG